MTQVCRFDPMMLRTIIQPYHRIPHESQKTTMPEITADHPAVKATAEATYRALSGSYGDFTMPSLEKALGILTAAMQHLTADNLPHPFGEQNPVLDPEKMKRTWADHHDYEIDVEPENNRTQIVVSTPGEYAQFINLTVAQTRELAAHLTALAAHIEATAPPEPTADEVAIALLQQTEAGRQLLAEGRIQVTATDPYQS